jgi:hypothetical protein
MAIKTPPARISIALTSVNSCIILFVGKFYSLNANFGFVN